MSQPAKGETLWIIPDGYIPPSSRGELVSHESVCVLNCQDTDANLSITVYFEDRPPIENIPAVVPAKRTRHIRTSSFCKEGESIPVGIPYAMEVASDIPVFVQYSRLDATQAENALMSTMGYPVRKD